MSKFDTTRIPALRKRKDHMTAKRRTTAAALIIVLIVGVVSIVSASIDSETHYLLGAAREAYSSEFSLGDLVLNIVGENSPLDDASEGGYDLSNGDTEYGAGGAQETSQGADSYAQLQYEQKGPQRPAPYINFAAYSLPNTDPEAFGHLQFYTRIQGPLYPIHFGMPETYSSLAGITTFRGNNFRNTASWGTVNVTQERLAIKYQFGVGRTERQDTITCRQADCTEEDCTTVHTRTVRWTGVGWPGQPAIIQWDFEVQQMMNLNPEFRDKEDLVEVIYASLDGFIHFFELSSGRQTRPRINVGEPMKSSVTIDPRGYPILYVGQSDQMRTERFGYYIFSLIDGTEMFHLNGRDPFAWRMWGAFDGTPLFDTANDRMVLIGENGVVYSMEMNTVFDRQAKTISVDPVISRYRHTGTRVVGTENSPVAFGHYMWFADNSGLIQCLDLRTLEPVWVFDAGDDTDATIVLEWEEENERLVLFTATSVDLQGQGGSAYIRKLNAANGQMLWEYSVRSHFNPNFNGGVLATPVVGKHDISNLVIFWVGQVIGRGGGGTLIAFDKQTGEIVWERVLPVFGWSSPVAVYTDEGKSYLIVSDAQGDMRLIRGTTGEVLHRISLGSNIEASAAVFGNYIVVGTRGERIFGIEIQ